MSVLGPVPLQGAGPKTRLTSREAGRSPASLMSDAGRSPASRLVNWLLASWLLAQPAGQQPAGFN